MRVTSRLLSLPMLRNKRLLSEVPIVHDLCLRTLESVFESVHLFKQTQRPGWLRGFTSDRVNAATFELLNNELQSFSLLTNRSQLRQIDISGKQLADPHLKLPLGNNFPAFQVLILAYNHMVVIEHFNCTTFPSLEVLDFSHNFMNCDSLTILKKLET
jgi:hypothetical protein